MKCIVLILFFCGFVCLAHSNGQRLLVDDIRNDFLNLENELWTYILKHNKENSVDPGLEIIKKFKEFDKRVQQLPENILYGMDVPRETKQFLTIYSDLRVIHDLYDKFRRYQLEAVSPVKNDYSEYRRELKTSYIVDDILNDENNNINKTINQIFEQTFGSKKGNNLVGEVFEKLSPEDHICKHPTQPVQQVFYNLYNLYASTDLKGYILTQFAYMALRLQETGNHTTLSLESRKFYKTRTQNAMTTIVGLMQFTHGKIYRCDPKDHIEGQTYSQVTQLIQAHIENEVDMNPSKTCTENCGSYSSTKNYGCYDTSSDYCRKVKPCKGNIYNCQFVESHMKTCVSPVSSPRRYDYIAFDSGKVLGEKTRCLQKSVNSWFRWFVHCSYCLCFCDEQGPQSDRYFNLRGVMADTKNNRVVTGLRLIKYNKIFHIQIQEGKLLPYGYIDQNTTRWVKVDNYKITDQTTKRGRDYHIMDYQSRSLFLDDLEVERENYIITGARFLVKNGDLQFRITVTPFNFTTGELDTQESYEVLKISNREKINIPHPDIPIYSPPSKPIFEQGKYLDFTYTDLDKDAGQTTIPFIDIQPVYAEPAVPLRGVGIYYKGHPGYGGFVGMRAQTYDYTSGLIFDFPDPNEREDTEEVYGVLSA